MTVSGIERRGRKFSDRFPQLRPNGLTYSNEILYKNLQGSIDISHAPPKGRGPSFPQFWGPSFLRPNGLNQSEIWNDNMWESSVFLGGQPHPVQGGGAPASSKIFGTSYMHVYSMRSNNQSLHGDQTDEKNFTRSTTNADARSASGS